MRVLASLSASLLALATSFASTAQAQGGVTRYCQSGAAGATIAATGSADFAANGGSGDLVLHASGLPAGAVGLFFYGPQAQPATPLGAGSLCVGGGAPVWRLGVVPSSAGAATQPVDYLAPPDPAARITPGSTWHFQFWFRAQGSSDTTDALRIQFVPPGSIGPVTTVAHWLHSGHPLGQQSFTGGVVVIDSDLELRDFWGLHTAGFQPPPPLPNVDLSLNTVIAVFIGRRLTLGYDVTVTDVSLSVSTLHVSSDESVPCNGALFAESNPMVLVAVPKVPGATLGSWTPTTLGCP